MLTVDEMIEALVGREGAYANHASDKGGETMWGITIAVARENGYTGPMRSMPRGVAKEIYLKKYYVKPKFDQVGLINTRIAEEMFDTGVNMGPYWGGLFLQRSLNALNRQGQDYADIKADGDCGPGTRGALKAYLAKRGVAGVTVLMKAMNVLQGARYIELSEGRQKNEDFTYGWLANRVEL